MDVFRNRWWVVVASALGLMVGAGALNVFAFGVLLKPIAAELGIGRGLLSSAMTLSSTMNAIACPIVGWMIDRWGARRVMIPGLLLCAVAIACHSEIVAAPFALTYLIFGVGGFVFGCQTPVAYATVTSHWFDRQRGLALGLAIAGVGLGVAVMPQIAAALIGTIGWRLAFVGLAGCVLLFALVPVSLFIREPPDRAARAQRRAASSAAGLPGVAIGAALRQPRFYALAGGFFLAVIAINGTLVHLVPLLTDRGIPLQVATATLSGTGLALIGGRVLSGWCLDRLWGPYVAVGFFLAPMVGIALLASGADGGVPLAGAVLCGLGIGAEVDLMAFFVSRYFGLRDYAKIYGTMFALFSFGVGVGPVLSGASFDLFHSYRPIFMVYELLLAATCGLLVRLGPYPYPAPARPARGAEAVSSWRDA